MLWSILIAGIPERYHTVHALLRSLLEDQTVARISDIELLYLMDNRRRPVGAKRNDLMSLARGRYISFIDDDDDVADDYIKRIYKTLTRAKKSDDPLDVVCFRQLAHLEPHNVIHDCHYSLAYYRERTPENRRMLEPSLDTEGKPLPNVLKWTGPPAHTMVWRRELVKEIPFPEKTFGEDTAWVDACCEKAQSEIVLDGEALYHYRFNEAKSATR